MSTFSSFHSLVERNGKGRPTLRRVPASLASDFRRDVRKRLIAKGYARTTKQLQQGSSTSNRVAVLTPLLEVKNDDDRGSRWLLRAMQDEMPLTLQDAIEIAERAWLVGIVMSDTIMEQLWHFASDDDRLDPAILVFPGEAKRLAAALAQEALACSKDRLEARFFELLEPYERANSFDPVRSALMLVARELGTPTEIAARKVLAPSKTLRRELREQQLKIDAPVGAAYDYSAPTALSKLRSMLRAHRLQQSSDSSSAN